MSMIKLLFVENLGGKGDLAINVGNISWIT